MTIKQVFFITYLNVHFVGNCIEVDELQTLLEPEWKDVLHSLIPVPGHRMRFVKNLKELIKEGKSESIEVRHH